LYSCAARDSVLLGQYRTKGVSPESREIFVWNKDKSTGIAALFRAFWTPFPRKKIRENGAHDLCGVALGVTHAGVLYLIACVMLLVRDGHFLPALFCVATEQTILRSIVCPVYIVVLQFSMAVPPAF
jgi:hypothetical protein